MAFSAQQISKVRESVYSFQWCFTLHRSSGLILAVVYVNFIPCSASRHNNFHLMLQKCDWFLGTIFLVKICWSIFLFSNPLWLILSFMVFIRPAGAFVMSISNHHVCNIWLWLPMSSVRFYLWFICCYKNQWGSSLYLL